jgi:hypothetical protein
MVDVNKLYASPYLKAADLPQGRRATAEIVAGSTAWFDQRDGSQREKVVLTLHGPSGQEWPKQFVVNPTNGRYWPERSAAARPQTGSVSASSFGAATSW